MKKVSVNVILLLLLVSGWKTSKIPPDVFVRKLNSSTGNFIQYHSGNLPIILSASHGGMAKPDSLPDRSCTGCVTTADLNTTELAILIDSFITVKTGCYAHLVFSNLHRVKLDANRNLPEAIDGNIITKPFYDRYHDFMQAASDSVKKKHRKGLVIDIHGHGHTIQRLEIGYLLSEKILRLNDLNLPPSCHSIRCGLYQPAERREGTGYFAGGQRFSIYTIETNTGAEKRGALF
jgi:hypothetical protein